MFTYLIFYMLKIHIHKNAEDVIAYHREHLQGAISSYYSQDGQSKTMMFGSLIETLELKDVPLNAETFEALIKGKHPITGKKLSQRENPNERAGFDCVFSDPKSASIFAEVMGDSRIHDARLIALKEAVKELEKLAGTRVRKNGVMEDRATGSILGLCFEHHTSRANDPQCHFHLFIPNFTFDPVEKRFKALQPAEIFRRSGLLTEIYRNALVRELNRLGYATVNTKSGFEIKGVSRSLIEKYSKRQAQIDKEEAKEKARSSKITNSKKLRDKIAQSSRKAKESHSRESLRRRWLAELTPEELSTLTAIKENAKSPITPKGKGAEEAIEWAKSHLFERRSVIPQHKLVEEALRHNRGHNSLEELEAVLQEQTKKGEVILRDGQLTTPEILEEEQELLSFVNSEITKFPAFNEKFQISGGLSPDQRKVVGEVLLSQSRVTGIRGAAGTGKTTTLKETLRGLRSVGYRVLVVAPSSSAVEVVRADKIPSAETLQRFLTDTALQKDLSGGVVVLDEATLASMKQLNALVKTARENNLRLILLGDTNQHGSVERGDALRLLQDHSKMPTSSLNDIVRQTGAYRDAVNLLKDGHSTEAFDSLDSLGWIREMNGSTKEGRGAELAKEFAQAVKKGESAIAVSPTLRESAEVNLEIRSALRSLSVLGTTESEVETLTPLYKTEAERSSSAIFREDDVLLFNQKSKLFARGEEIRVVREDAGLLVVRRANGEIFPINPARYAKNFSVYSPSKISVSKGERLLLKANGKTADGRQLINGQLVTVKSIRGNKITLEDGRIIPSNYRTFGHGYCITSQASQGKTVDRVFVSIDAQSAHSATTFEGFYVAVSRGRKSCRIFTDSKDELREAIIHSSARKTATEYLQEIEKNYEYPTPTHIKRNPIPKTVKLATPIGKPPGSSRTDSRSRNHHKLGTQPENTKCRVIKDSLHSDPISRPDLQGRGSTNDKIHGSQLRKNAPELGRGGKER